VKYDIIKGCLSGGVGFEPRDVMNSQTTKKNEDLDIIYTLLPDRIEPAIADLYLLHHG
jgi:hypothetical protein